MEGREANDDGAFSLDMDYFSFHYSTDKMFTGKFVELFGDPRKPGDKFFTEPTGYPAISENVLRLQRTREHNQHYADVAASIQRVTEEIC